MFWFFKQRLTFRWVLRFYLLSWLSCGLGRSRIYLHTKSMQRLVSRLRWEEHIKRVLGWSCWMRFSRLYRKESCVFFCIDKWLIIFIRTKGQSFLFQNLSDFGWKLLLHRSGYRLSAKRDQKLWKRWSREDRRAQGVGLERGQCPSPEKIFEFWLRNRRIVVNSNVLDWPLFFKSRLSEAVVVPFSPSLAAWLLPLTLLSDLHLFRPPMR